MYIFVTVVVTTTKKSTEVIESESEDVQNIFLHHIYKLSCIKVMFTVFPWKIIQDQKILTKNCNYEVCKS